MRQPKKIVVIGPESTGKSTLSESLAVSLNAAWVPEFARKYLETLNRVYTQEDLLIIADGQLQAEAEANKNTPDLVICDTDLYVIKVWSEAKYNTCDRRILELIAKSNYDLYLLTDIDIPWADDPLREHPDPQDRQYFFHQYKDIVQQSGVPWVLVSGNEDKRLVDALIAIQQLE